MSERKNHLTIEGGVVKDDEQVASYKAIPESDTEFRTSKSSLSKSKEKVATDEAEEKLLDKEEEAKIVTRVDMADAKYVVGDHRNGDAKIELDANKRQFSGLTKEELLQYADDPFWVRLRWFMFILFWAMWLAMLAGAIAIIVRAPKCYPPPPKTWYEKGPLVDMSGYETFDAMELELEHLQQSGVEGIFTFACRDTYEVLETPDCIDKFRNFYEKAKKHSVKVIVDLTANFVSKTHKWFAASEEGDAQYKDYFIWKPVDKRDAAGDPLPPNKWVSTVNKPAWSLSEKRKEFYLHQYGAEFPDLNFNNPEVVNNFDKVITMWMNAGADGIRLYNARELLVNSTFGEEIPATGAGSTPGVDHTMYLYWRHKEASDLPDLDKLLDRWSKLVNRKSEDTNVFTTKESGSRPELYVLGRAWSLRPASAAPVPMQPAAAARLAARLARGRWPAMQLISGADPDAAVEVAAFSLLLPAAPVLTIEQLDNTGNDTNHVAAAKSFSNLISLRSDATIQHGNYSVSSVPVVDSNLTVIACARWKTGHTGFLSVYNPNDVQCDAQLNVLPTVPADLKIHHVSAAVRDFNNYTLNKELKSDHVSIPPRSTLVLSYVPKTSAEI